MKHVSYFIERTLFFASIILCAVSVFLFLLNIDSFTGLASLKTAQIVDSCSKTLPVSLPCSEFDECAEGYNKELALTKNGKTLCCCMPPPEISITTN